MQKPFVAVLLTVGLLLSACADGSGPSGRQVGAAVGATIGAILGSKVGSGSGSTVSAVFGGLAGAWLGGELGRKLDEQDLALANDATQDALENEPAGGTTTWENPDSGNAGSVTPVSEPFEMAESDECRDFESTVNVDGETETAHGRACRQPDGSWQIVQ